MMNFDLRRSQSQCFVTLLCLLFLFFGRVVGQLSVVLFHLPFLPPMDEWYSGFFNYPVLFLCQVAILLFYGKICFDLKRGQGYFAAPKKNLGDWLLIIGPLYLLTMIIRYAIQMSLYPQERWTGGAIPIFFHCLLASFLIVLGAFHRTNSKVEANSGHDENSNWSKPFVRRTFAALAIFSISAWALSQLATFFLAEKMHLRSSEFAVRADKNASFLTSDGVRLVAEIYHPQHINKTPTILVRIPFSKSWKNSLFSSVIGRLWAERGYTVVIQGTRGRYKSNGAMYPLVNERKDGIETIQWISKQPWFNGKIGSWGGSAFGYTQWCISDQVDPGLAAMFIYESSTDFRSMFYPGDAFSLASALNWAGVSHGKKDRSKWFATEELAKSASGLPMLEADERLTGEEIDFFRDWALHSKRDQYWDTIDGSNRNQLANAPALLMAGWYDPFLPAQLDDFNKMRQSNRADVGQHSRLIVGPWRHAHAVKLPNCSQTNDFRIESFAQSLPFFDELLKPEGARKEAEPIIKIFVQGKNYWRTEQEWPLKRTRFTTFYLSSEGSANGTHSNGKLTPALPLYAEAQDRYFYDPSNPVPTAGGAMLGIPSAIEKQNNIESRSDVLNFTSTILNQDLEVTGPISAYLNVTTTAPTTDFTAKLVDVYPDGSAFNICDGIRRSSFENPSANNEIKIDLCPTSNVFLAGHRIRLEISSSNFPRYNLNLNTGQSNENTISISLAKQTLKHGVRFPSRLILPVIPRQNEETFAIGAKL